MGPFKHNIMSESVFEPLAEVYLGFDGHAEHDDVFLLCSRVIIRWVSFFIVLESHRPLDIS